MMIKKILYIASLLIASTLPIFAEPSGRGYDPDAPDLGLPGSNEVFIGLLIAIIAIPIGYAILNSGKNEDSSDESLFPGCLGILFIGGGILCLLPLVAWICSILSVIVAIGFIAFIVFAIIGFFMSKNK
jgi:hypothetical protein